MANYRARFVYSDNVQNLVNQLTEDISQCVAANEGGNNWTITFNNCYRDETYITEAFGRYGVDFVTVEEI
jgi:hypothetical protein